MQTLLLRKFAASVVFLEEFLYGFSSLQILVDDLCIELLS